jgi:thiamine-monophosphate kinase
MSALGEFALIARYFTRPSGERRGVGDDCALIDVGTQTLALTSDMLFEGVHFFAQADARALGHKALAVNLSDLAAAGARPRCFLLDVALPRAEEAWLEAFCAGLFALAEEHRCALIGGDTTRSPALREVAGPIVIAITAIGEVAPGAARGRDGAQPGDDLWVSGALGEAALALAVRRAERGLASGLPDGLDWRRPDESWQSGLQRCRQRMDRPTPRVTLGQALCGLASAAIDVSDGLIGDLGHILERSGVGAELAWQDVPCAPVVAGLEPALRQRCVLAGGDDYELLFTAPVRQRAAVQSLATAQLPLARIGRITATSGLRIVDGDPSLPGTTLQAFDHFLAKTEPESGHGQR